MTYCLGILNRSGLVLAADSRTNAGVDYISCYQKLFDFTLPGQRSIILCSSGNLSITQGVIHLISQDLRLEEGQNLHTLPTMYDVATYLGDTIRKVQERDRPWLQKDGIDHNCNFLLGGQIPGDEPQLYLLYTQGNFIQATYDTPFLQIGEAKYGKPILDRTVHYDTSIEAVAKCALLSIDSTMKSNISVGPPINMVMYERDSFVIRHHLRLPLGAPYLAKIRKLWEVSVRNAFEQMPNVDWEQYSEQATEDCFPEPGD